MKVTRSQKEAGEGSCAEAKAARALMATMATAAKDAAGIAGLMAFATLLMRGT